ncbi:hypothetical protein SAMN04487981_104151 [Streptomyces sp. cf386]|uniref:hypothetical protein n=1 Tax=Streptomyces sp. cf386 TaxID=1761904 RepID=UPI000889C556|nr:hypothetical protein SAMN04487981_104151 [Streptomyces sp. cf386]
MLLGTVGDGAEPGRLFASLQDFNQQLREWLVRANTRTVRAFQGRPVQVITDPVHADTAAKMREGLATDRHRRQATVRQHTDGHTIAPRAVACGSPLAAGTGLPTARSVRTRTWTPGTSPLSTTFSTRFP